MFFRSLCLAGVAALSFAFAHPEDAPLCPDYGVNRVGSMVTEGYGVIAYGDFLYWTAQMDGLDLALRLTPFVNNINDGKMIEQNFQWDSAFRIGLGYYFKQRGWDLNLEWTSFRTSASKVENANGNTLHTLWGRVGVSETNTLQRISGHWDLEYDTLDLLLHPTPFRYGYFSVQPTIGLRYARIDWDYKIMQHYLDVGDITLVQTLPYNNRYHGGGFVAGLNTKWWMGYGLHVYAGANASLLYGEFKTVQHSNVLFNGQTEFKTTTTQDYWRVRANMHLIMGLGWEQLFANNSVRLNLHVGYEFLTWFNQNQLYRSRSEIFGATNLLEYTPTIERDDLGINGLTVGALLEF